MILAIAGVFGGGDEESGSPAEATTATDEAGSTVTDEVARIVMQPQGDSEASGEAVIGLANETQPFIDLDLQDLPEISNDEAYIFWFLLSEDSGFPLPGALPISSEGAIQDRLAIPSQTLGFVVQSRFLAVSIVDRRELASEIDDAIKERAGELPFSGEPVLLGEIPAETEGQLPGAGAGGAGAGALPEAVPPEAVPPEAVPPRPSLLRARRPHPDLTRRDQLPGVHDPGRVEALLQRPQGLDARLAHLGLHVGGVVAADRVVVGDRSPRPDDRLGGGRLRGAPLLDLLAGTGPGQRR